MSDNQLATTEAPKQVSIVRSGERGIQFSTLGEIGKFAAVAVNSGIYKDLPSPEVAIIKIQAGLELGLTPVWALTNIFVVNGKPTVYGDALLGIILGHPDCADVIETTTGSGETMVATCEVVRRGRAPVVRTFSVEDAKRAGLWKTEPKTKKVGRDGKPYEVDSGPWYSYPTRMLAMRARAFACRDAFADALRGIAVREEIQDIEPRPIQGRTVEPVENLQFADEATKCPQGEAVGREAEGEVPARTTQKPEAGEESASPAPRDNLLL